jgi:phage-related protein
LKKKTRFFDPEMSVLNRQGQFDVKFSCKPQTYLKSGEKPKEFTASGSIYNPTMFDALPLMRIYGEGELEIGLETIRVKRVDNYIDIDCELEDAYKEFAGNNRNIHHAV